MKKLKLAVILGSLLLTSTSAFSGGDLNTETIQGTWKLESTRQSVKSGSTVIREDTWVFSNKGTVAIKHIPREGGYYDQLPVKYEIDAGKLKVGILGRTGRFDTFTLIDIDDNNMVLKARFGDIYTFKK